MNSKVDVLKSREFGDIRIIKKDDKIWFVANDLAKVLVKYYKQKNVI